MSSDECNEPLDNLDDETRDMHRALVSLVEELEAVDWYQQRVSAAGDEELRRILAHNRDEEKEHASMVLEWLRRHDAHFDEHLRTYLLTDGDITALEDDGSVASASCDGSLGIGSLRQKGAKP
jgi:ferritin-like protein